VLYQSSPPNPDEILSQLFLPCQTPRFFLRRPSVATMGVDRPFVNIFPIPPYARPSFSPPHLLHFLITSFVSFPPLFPRFFFPPLFHPAQPIFLSVVYPPSRSPPSDQRDLLFRFPSPPSSLFSRRSAVFWQPLLGAGSSLGEECKSMDRRLPPVPFFFLSAEFHAPPPAIRCPSSAVVVFC